MVECLLPKQKIAGSSPVTRSTETKMNIIPDRLVAGRKILALLTVVRIHLRENKKQIPNRHLFFISEKYSLHANSLQWFLRPRIKRQRSQLTRIFITCIIAHLSLRSWLCSGLSISENKLNYFLLSLNGLETFCTLIISSKSRSIFSSCSSSAGLRLLEFIILATFIIAREFKEALKTAL